MSAEGLGAGMSVAEGQKRRKFILFVGNLTFDTTEADLQTFFGDCKPSSVRLITDKATRKPKGFAFVEFTGSKNLEIALQKDKAKLKGRKVNIELTAGGGGSKSAVRKERIKSKNEKLRSEKKKLPEQTEAGAYS
jgi:nucleolar protein 6